MCTVTFVKLHGKVVITSNRDEQPGRPAAIPPREYNTGSRELYFPKDSKAGGTWFVSDKEGNVAVLLNGAAEPHEFRSDWRKSRGLVLLDIFSTPNPVSEFKTLDLDMIEPFTIVLWHREQLMQLSWDGSVREELSLPSDMGHIWSSSPLYSKEVREYRTGLFARYAGTVSDEDQVLAFHQMTDEANPGNSIIIDRDGMLKTLSITQAVIEENRVKLSYLDLATSESTSLSFTISR